MVAGASVVIVMYFNMVSFLFQKRVLIVFNLLHIDCVFAKYVSKYGKTFGTLCFS